MLIEHIKSLGGLDETRLEYFNIIPAYWKELEEFCDDIETIYVVENDRLITISVSNCATLLKWQMS
jgi:hypothetical protein